MDIRLMQMILNGAQAEIEKLEEPMQNFQGLSVEQVEQLQRYSRRKEDMIEAIKSQGFDLLRVKSRWFITPRRKLEGIDVLAPQ